MHTLLQSAYVLHTRLYRETSVLLELFTKEQGRISAVARGARRPRSPFRGILQPFVSLLISWVGKTDLVTLTHAEARAYLSLPVGRHLFSALYLNELLMRVLQRYDAYPALYAVYQTTLIALSTSDSPEPALRLFEKQVLGELGYGLRLTHEADTENPIVPSGLYRYEPQRGFLSQPAKVMTPQQLLFPGASLLALHTGKFEQASALRDAKRLMRLALAPLLGDKPLKSGELFPPLEGGTLLFPPLKKGD